MAAPKKSTKEEVQSLKKVKKFSGPSDKQMNKLTKGLKAIAQKAVKTQKAKAQKEIQSQELDSFIAQKEAALKAGDKALAKKLRRQIRKIKSS